MNNLAPDFNNANSDGFIAEVLGAGSSDGYWSIQPLITELDGTTHIKTEARARDGMQPQTGDYVFVSTMRNNLDLAPINRFFAASESNCVILGVIKTSSAQNYFLKGNYNFEGNLTVQGNLNVTGDLIVTGDAIIDGDAEISGIDFVTHTHGPGTFAAGGDPVLGESGSPV